MSYSIVTSHLETSTLIEIWGYYLSLFLDRASFKRGGATTEKVMKLNLMQRDTVQTGSSILTAEHLVFISFYDTTNSVCVCVCACMHMMLRSDFIME